MIPYTRTILTPPTPDQHHRMLLDIVPFPGYVRRDHSPSRQTHSSSLSFGGIGLLGPRDADFEADTFEFRRADRGEGRGDCFAGALASTTALGEEKTVSVCLEGGWR